MRMRMPMFVCSSSSNLLPLLSMKNTFFFQLFIGNMQFSTSTFGLLQCHDIYAAIEIGLDCRSLDESHLI